MALFNVRSKMIPTSIPLLVLHFDINKTIIISDSGTNITADQMLNSLLSECIWGILKPKTEMTGSPPIALLALAPNDIKNTPVEKTKGEEEFSVPDGYRWSIDDWTVCCNVPRSSPPEEYSVTFSDFVESYSFEKGMTKKEMKSAKTRFTEKGMAGEKCSGSLKVLQNSLRIPKSFMVGSTIDRIDDKNENIDDDYKSESNIIKNILKSGSYHIIPSFFKLISYLHQSKVNFRIIFRTFGVDIENVAEEFNLYCEGRHPLFPLTEEDVDTFTANAEADGGANAVNEGNQKNLSRNVPVKRVRMDGAGGTNGTDQTEGIDRRLSLPSSLGVLRRVSGDGDGVSVTYTNNEGIPEKVQGFSALYDLINRWFIKNEYENNCETSPINDDNVRTGEESGRRNGTALNKQLSDTSRSIVYTAAIQDDYSYWAGCGENDVSGKLLLVDRASDRRPMHIFFDDNIERDRSHIVDVRWSDSFLPVPLSLSAGVYIQRVEPYRAVTDEDYFIELLGELIEKQMAL